MESFFLKQRDVVNFEEVKARKAITVGMSLYGYCGGIFGQDSYEEKIIMEIISNYIQVKYMDGSFGGGIVESWAQLVRDSNEEYEKIEKYDA